VSILCQACSSQSNRDAEPQETQKIARVASGFVTTLGSASGSHKACLLHQRCPGHLALLILAFAGLKLSEGGRWLVAGISTKERGDGDVRGAALDSILLFPDLALS